jgi:hypothetical protein
MLDCCILDDVDGWLVGLKGLQGTQGSDEGVVGVGMRSSQVVASGGQVLALPASNEDPLGVVDGVGSLQGRVVDLIDVHG